MEHTTTTPRRDDIPAYFLGRPRAAYIDRYARTTRRGPAAPPSGAS